MGFILGPRINAAGRMSSPDTALRLLTTEEPAEAKPLAQVLDEENKAVVLDVNGTSDDDILIAAQSCPTAAIFLYDEEGKLIFPSKV